MLSMSKFIYIMKKAKISELTSSKYKLRKLLFKHCKLVSSSWEDEWKNNSIDCTPTEEDSITFNYCIDTLIVVSSESKLKIKLTVWNGNTCYGYRTSPKCYFYFETTKLFKELIDILFSYLKDMAFHAYEMELERQREEFIKNYISNLLKD